MSFQEARSAISICNKALSRIMQQPLSGSLDDSANANKHSARECNTWYKTIVREVLTAHHWGLATVRVQLASAPSNGRAAEWAYAYLPPSDMAFPVSVGETVSSGATISYYRGLGYLLAMMRGQPLFRYEGGIFYTNIADTSLDYVTFNLTEQDFNEAVEGLIVIFLASQLARSVAKDHKLAKELHDEGQNKMNLEIARSLNMSRQVYGDYVTESELVRDGADPRLGALGYLG
jgi:hypothetical protein